MIPSSLTENWFYAITHKPPTYSNSKTIYIILTVVLDLFTYLLLLQKITGTASATSSFNETSQHDFP